MKRTNRSTPDTQQPPAPPGAPAQPPGRQDLGASRDACRWGVWSGVRPPGVRYKPPYALGSDWDRD